MPYAPAQPDKLLATLVLDDAVHLTGEISCLPDGRLQLDAILPVAELEPGKPFRVEAGSVAKLFIEDNSNEFSVLGESIVRLSSQQGDLNWSNIIFNTVPLFHPVTKCIKRFYKRCTI